MIQEEGKSCLLPSSCITNVALHFDNYISPEEANSTSLYMWHLDGYRQLARSSDFIKQKAAQSLCGCNCCSEHTVHKEGDPLCFSLRMIEETVSPISLKRWPCSSLQVELLQLGPIPLLADRALRYTGGTEPIKYVAQGLETLHHLCSMGLDSSLDQILWFTWLELELCIFNHSWFILLLLLVYVLMHMCKCF